MKYQVDIHEIPQEFQEFDKEHGIHLFKTPLVLVRGFHKMKEARDWIKKYNKEAKGNFAKLKEKVF